MFIDDSAFSLCDVIRRNEIVVFLFTYSTVLCDFLRNIYIMTILKTAQGKMGYAWIENLGFNQNHKIFFRILEVFGGKCRQIRCSLFE